LAKIIIGKGYFDLTQSEGGEFTERDTGTELAYTSDYCIATNGEFCERVYPNGKITVKRNGAVTIDEMREV
jgi:hypothetical protein